ncbi:MAG TPA: NAD(P)(+) transhydrogenase (Re/Si-specific) subunit beta [Phycisphaerales bacterium]|nr:NAD(P)(+) transhydrogenase (Re/Si-specific) subunit beta [Phycisphaerales bacterium]
MNLYWTHLAYVIAAGLFVFSLHWMNTPKTARKSVIAGAVAMAIGVLATWFSPYVERTGETTAYILVPILLAIGPGIWLAKVPITAVPQRTALSHAFGGLAAGLVGTAKFFYWYNLDAVRAAELSTAIVPTEPAYELTHFRTIAIVFEVVLGFLTFTGSIIAAGKLQELKWIPQRPWVYKGQNLVNAAAFCGCLVLATILAVNPHSDHAPWMFGAIIVLALNFGWMLVMPIGGADMPTVIAILNSYAGLAAVAMGFVLDNPLLIVAGALDGASGLILSIIMCKAMNRSFTNVLFGAFGQVAAKAAGDGKEKTHRSAGAEEAAGILEAAQRVVIVPGYGLAVSQAQHKVRELYDALTKKGIDVRFAIHPVAGRMPGHMNVLLAEADIPYDKLVEMDDINPEMPQVDVALVIGANDVTNPAARHDKASPIYGMPIIDTDKAHSVMVIKRSMNPGFAGIDNELYYLDKTLMLFGDAKGFVGEIVKALSGGGGH